MSPALKAPQDLQAAMVPLVLLGQKDRQVRPVWTAPLQAQPGRRAWTPRCQDRPVLKGRRGLQGRAEAQLPR